jgi:hypothetical protein
VDCHVLNLRLRLKYHTRIDWKKEPDHLGLRAVIRRTDALHSAWQYGHIVAFEFSKFSPSTTAFYAFSRRCQLRDLVDYEEACCREPLEIVDLDAALPPSNEDDKGHVELGTAVLGFGSVQHARER